MAIKPEPTSESEVCQPDRDKDPVKPLKIPKAFTYATKILSDNGLPVTGENLKKCFKISILNLKFRTRDLEFPNQHFESEVSASGP